MGDSRSNEEPCVQGTGHERGHMWIEAQAFLEDGIRVIYHGQMVSIYQDVIQTHRSTH